MLVKFEDNLRLIVIGCLHIISSLCPYETCSNSKHEFDPSSELLRTSEQSE